MAGETFTTLGRVLAIGISERTEGTDDDSSLEAEVGIGPADSPLADWTWIPADPDESWTDPAAMTDQYTAELVIPAPGELRIAYRFRRGAAVDGPPDWGDWTSCDLSRGAGRDGSEDGLSIVDAAVILGLSPCDRENACGSPPLAECEDGSTLRTYETAPRCEILVGEASCTFPATAVDCALRTECAADACISDSVTIDWCRLDTPLSLELSPEAGFAATASIRAPGLTDRSAMVDTDERLRLDRGLGPVGSSVDSSAWRWTEGEADATWNDPDGVDRWLADLPGVGVGVGSWQLARRGSGQRRSRRQLHLLRPKHR